jgi:hypothetical protein
VPEQTPCRARSSVMDSLANRPAIQATEKNLCGTPHTYMCNTAHVCTHTGAASKCGCNAYRYIEQKRRRLWGTCEERAWFFLALLTIHAANWAEVPAPQPPLKEGAAHHCTASDEQQQPAGEISCLRQVPHLLPHKDGSKQAEEEPPAPCLHCRLHTTHDKHRTIAGR